MNYGLLFIVFMCTKVAMFVISRSLQLSKGTLKFTDLGEVPPSLVDGIKAPGNVSSFSIEKHIS